MNKRGVLGFFERFVLKKSIYDNAYQELSLLMVKDLMTKDVLFIHDHNKLTEAAHMMIGAHVSCLVVMDETKLKGIITERDFIRKYDMGKQTKSDLTVDALMTRDLYTIEPSADLFTSQKIMRTHTFRKLVVVQNNELKGIITQTDLCRAVARLKTPVINAPLVKDVMTKNVLTMASDDPFIKAKKLMASKDMGSVLVMDKNEIKGIFTEFDIVSEYFMNPNKLQNSCMKDLVTSPIISISPDFDMIFVNKLMMLKNFRRLPVMDGEKVVGMITQTDVARSLYQFIESQKDKKLTSEEKKRTMHTDYEVIKKGGVILYKKKAAQKAIANK